MSKRKKMLTAEEIKAAALDLPDDERDTLLDDLNRQLGAPEISPAVLAESERLLDAILSGRAETVSAEEFLTELEQDL